MTKKVDYEALKAELDGIMQDLQRDDLDVDAAIKKYQRGLEIVNLLQEHLKSADNTVRELKAAFDAGS